MGPRRASEFLEKHLSLVEQLDELKHLIGTTAKPVIYSGADKLIDVEQGYGISEKKPGDYLSDFNSFIKEQVNQHAAIKVVCKKPSDLSREQLREVRLLLDGQGYSEANLKSAWRNQTNQEIAASIIGYIRQAALGEPLMAFEDRVKKAMDAIYTKRAWTVKQKKWLDRLAKQLVHEVIIDQQFINESFADQGGYQRFDKDMGGDLDNVLSELKNNLWLVEA